MQRAAQSVDLF